jgi:hypothetical protein
MSDAVDLQAMQMVSLFSKAVPLPFHSEPARLAKLGAAEGRAVGMLADPITDDEPMNGALQVSDRTAAANRYHSPHLTGSPLMAPLCPSP